MLGTLNDAQIEMVLRRETIGRIGCHGLAEWRCVIAQGEFEELTGAAASAAMELLITRLAPLTTGETNTPTFGFRGDGPERDRRPRVFRIRLLERSGRFEKR